MPTTRSPIGLDVGREVAGVLQAMRERPHAWRQAEVVVAVRAHVVRVGRRLVHAGHERRAAGGADRRGGEDAREAHALRRARRVEVRRADQLFAVAAQVEADVLGDEPEDVGASSSFGRRGWQFQREQEEQKPPGLRFDHEHHAYLLKAAEPHPSALKQAVVVPRVPARWPYSSYSYFAGSRLQQPTNRLAHRAGKVRARSIPSGQALARCAPSLADESEPSPATPLAGYVDICLIRGPTCISRVPSIAWSWKTARC